MEKTKSRAQTTKIGSENYSVTKIRSVWVRIPLQLLFNYEECVCLKIGKEQKKVLGVVDTVGQDCETKRNMLEHLKSHPEYQRRENVNHTWICQFCNQSFKSRRKLYAHNKNCTERLKLDTDSIGRIKNPIAQTNRLKSYNENRKAGIKINRPALTEEHKKSNSNGELNEKDLKKMNYIKEKLNCRFFRYNESLNELKEF